MLNSTVLAEAKFIAFGCKDGIRELVVKFDRQAVIDLILDARRRIK
jgi:hypothetical protein